MTLERSNFPDKQLQKRDVFSSELVRERRPKMNILENRDFKSQCKPFLHLTANANISRILSTLLKHLIQY